MITLRRFMPLLLALTLAACGGSGGSGGNSGTGSAQIASDPSALLNDNRPVHNVYFDAEGFAPFVMSDADNRPSGFGIELVQAIADKQGFRPNFIPHAFSTMLQDVGKGKGADLAIAAITITDERKAIVDFANPHFETSMGLLVPANSPITSVSGVKGRNIATVAGTVGETELAKLQAGDGTIIHSPSAWAATRQVMRKEADGVFADFGPLNYYANTYKDQKLRVITDADSPKDYYAIAVKKGDPELVKKINRGLDQIKADGTYDKIYQKWFAAAPDKPAPAQAE